MRGKISNRENLKSRWEKIIDRVYKFSLVVWIILMLIPVILIILILLGYIR